MRKHTPKWVSATIRVGLAMGGLAGLTPVALAETTTPPPEKLDAGTATPPTAATPGAKPASKPQPFVAPSKSRSWNFKSKPNVGAAAPSAESAEPPPAPPSGGDEKHPGGVEHAPSGGTGQ